MFLQLCECLTQEGVRFDPVPDTVNCCKLDVSNMGLEPRQVHSSRLVQATVAPSGLRRPQPRCRQRVKEAEGFLPAAAWSTLRWLYTPSAGLQAHGWRAGHSFPV